MVKLQVYVDAETASRIDDARGLAPLSAWVKHAIQRQLDGGAVQTQPLAPVVQLRTADGRAVAPALAPEPEPEDDVVSYERPTGIRRGGGRRK